MTYPDRSAACIAKHESIRSLITWKSGDGVSRKIKDLSDTHLENVLNELIGRCTMVSRDMDMIRNLIFEKKYRLRKNITVPDYKPADIQNCDNLCKLLNSFNGPCSPLVSWRVADHDEFELISQTTDSKWLNVTMQVKADRLHEIFKIEDPR